MHIVDVASRIVSSKPYHYSFIGVAELMSRKSRSFKYGILTGGSDARSNRKSTHGVYGAWEDASPPKEDYHVP
jgi:hypothetical protein